MGGVAGFPINQSDALKIAQSLGKQGKPLPAEMRKDPRLVAAYDQAQAAGNPPASIATPGGPAIDGPARPAPAGPAAGRPPSSSSGGRRPRSTGRSRSAASASSRGYVSRAMSPTAAVQRVPGVRQVISGGDGGGLFLVLILYPLVLATLQYGPAGPGRWFRAKWLNDVPWDGVVVPQRPPGWKGEWPPPGHTTSGPPGTVPE